MAKSHNLLKIGDVSRILGVHPNTLRRWEEEGKLVPHVRFQGKGTRYYHPDDVEAMKQNQHRGDFMTLEQIEVALGVDLTNCGWAYPTAYYSLAEFKAKEDAIREYLSAIS